MPAAPAAFAKKISASQSRVDFSDFPGQLGDLIFNRRGLILERLQPNALFRALAAQIAVADGGTLLAGRRRGRKDFGLIVVQIPVITRGRASRDEYQLVNGRLDEAPVMADEHHSARKIVQCKQKFLARVDIEMIGRFVQNEQIG